MNQKKSKNIKKRKVHKKKRRIKFGRVFIAIILLVFIIYLTKNLCRFPIKNFYISGNEILKDQEVIDLSKLRDYPSILKYNTMTIKKNIEKSDYVKKATVKKRNLKEIYIEIEENTILFYNSKTKKTVMLNKKEINKELRGPVLINYVPDKIYEKLKEEMTGLKKDVIKRISEIKYDPSNVDEERFLLTMDDGNYVYVTLDKINNINNYVKISLEIIDKFGKKNGILYLDAGGYFEIFED